MTQFNQKRFSVSMALSEEGRSNWDRCFGPKKAETPQSLPDPLAPRTASDAQKPLQEASTIVTVRRDDLMRLIERAPVGIDQPTIYLLAVARLIKAAGV